jgi:hypothetical protein
MPSTAESVHSVALLAQTDRCNSEVVSSPVRPSVNGAKHGILKAVNALGWASIGVLFAHAVLASVQPSLCLLGCEPVDLTASQSTSAPTSRDGKGSSDRSP